VELGALLRHLGAHGGREPIFEHRQILLRGKRVRGSSNFAASTESADIAEFQRPART
jgi:hypothetical protein